VSEQPSLKLRTEAVRLWGLNATQNAEQAIQNTGSLISDLEAYDGMVSVGGYVQAGLADLREALAYLRRAKATIAPIVDRRLTEERQR